MSTSTAPPATMAEGPGLDDTKSPVLRAAWNRYRVTLEELRAAIEASENYDAAPQQRARAYHALIEVQALTYNFALAPRLEHPRVFHNTSWQTDVYSVGGNGPDFHYGTVFLDGRQSYRLLGNVRDSQMLLAQLNSALPGSPGARLLANYDFSDFEVGEDGSIEATLSASREEGNWIALDPDSRYQWMLIRPTVETWDATPAELRIERIGSEAVEQYEADEFDEEAIASRIDAATDYARYIVEEWMIGLGQRVADNAGGTNRFAPLTEEVAGEVGSPTAEYVMAVFEVDDDEALILELGEEPNGAYWSFTLMDVWTRTLDFRARQAALNGRQISVDADGSVRIVISRQDPGIANWLDNLGYLRGQVVMRNYRATRSVVPVVQRVKFAELGDHLPASTERVTAAERQAELARRRESYRRRHGG